MVLTIDDLENFKDTGLKFDSSNTEVIAIAQKVMEIKTENEKFVKAELSFDVDMETETLISIYIHLGDFDTNLDTTFRITDLKESERTFLENYFAQEVIFKNNNGACCIVPSHKVKFVHTVKNGETSYYCEFTIQADVWSKTLEEL